MAGIKKVQGTVERVNSTQLPKPETFTYQGKTITSTHRHGIKLEGHDIWFNLGSSDKSDLVFEDDDGKWQILGAGSEVLIKYTENESNGKTYYNTKKSQVTVIDLVPGEKQQPKAQAASSGASETATSSRGGSGGVDWAKKDAGAAASASVDKALAFLAHNCTGVIDYDHVLSTARDMQRIVQTLASEILNPPQQGVAPSTKQSPEKPAPKKTTAKPAPPVEEFEDDNLDDVPWEG